MSDSFTISSQNATGKYLWKNIKSNWNSTISKNNWNNLFYSYTSFLAQLGETISIYDFSRTFRTIILTEILTISDSCERITQYNRILFEAVNFYDSPVRKRELFLSESLTFMDSFLRKANAIYSNIIIMNTEISSNNLAGVLHPAGYSEFKDFKTADYTFKDAILKIILETNSTLYSPNINAWEFNADLPDVRDVGVCHCTATNQPLTVKFNRVFHIVPEVILQIKSGDSTTTKVYLDAITLTGFTIQLKDGDVSKDGYVSWSAIGY